MTDMKNLNYSKKEAPVPTRELKEVSEANENTPASKPSKLFNKNFLLLWQGQFISQLGTQVAYIVLIIWIKEATGMAYMVGLSTMILALSQTIFNPIGGAVADSHSRKKIIVLTDVLSGITSILLALAMFTLIDVSMTIKLVLVIQFLYGTISAFFGPAVNAALPDIVPKDKLIKANTMRAISAQAASFFGQGVGGVLFSFVGAPLLFLINGITYFFSAFSELFITIPQNQIKSKKKSENLKNAPTKIFHDIKDGVKYIWKEKGIKNLILLFSFTNFFLSPFLILLPFFVTDFIKVGVEWFGFIMAGFGIGNVLGFIIPSVLGMSGKTRGSVAMISLTVFSFLSGSYGFVRNEVLALILFIIAGMIIGFFNLVFQTALQLKAPSEVRGRVFGVLGTVAGSLMPIGMGLSGIIADLVDKNIPMIFLVSGIMVFLITTAIFSKKESREVLTLDSSAEETR